MSLIPYLLNDMLYDRYDPANQLYDQYFGSGLLSEDLMPKRPSVLSLTAPLLAGYVRPYRHISPDYSGVSNIISNKDVFKINLDVQQFKPEEIDVKIVDDYIVVEGKHEEREDRHGSISRQFTRRYKLPSNVNMEDIVSNLSSDGILSVTAPKKVSEETGTRQIPIIQTNQPAINETKSGTRDSGDKMES